MPLTCSSTWIVTDGALSDVVRIASTDGSEEEQETDSVTTLHQPFDEGNCTIVLQGALQLVGGEAGLCSMHARYGAMCTT